MKKLESSSRQELAKRVWDLFIDNIEKLRIHYGKKMVFIVVTLDEEIYTDNVTEATMLERHAKYSEKVDVYISRDA